MGSIINDNVLIYLIKDNLTDTQKGGHEGDCGFSSGSPIYPMGNGDDQGRRNHGFQLDEADQQLAQSNVAILPEIVVHKCSTGSAISNNGNIPNLGIAQKTNELLTKVNDGEEEEMSGRMKSLKLIDDLMARKGSRSALSLIPNGAFPSKISEPPSIMFGMPKFQLAKVPMKKSQTNAKENIRNGIQTFLQNYLRFNNKFGIRHFAMIGFLALYAVLGGLMFEAIERQNEIEEIHEMSTNLDKSMTKMAINISKTLAVNMSEAEHEDLKKTIKEYYLQMLRIEEKYIGSVFHKYETLNLNLKLTWYFGSSIFYAMTLFTTIGYGTIACRTPLGKIASIFYAMFGIPLMLIVLNDMGQCILRLFTMAYGKGRQICKKWLHNLALRILDINPMDMEMKKKRRIWPLERTDSETTNGSCETTTTSSTKECDASAIMEVPLCFSIPVVLLYLVFVSFIVAHFDWDNENGKFVLDFGNAFYFTFFSLTTIGLGDVMPNKLQYSPLLAIIFIFGLALLSVVNSTVYMRIQRHFLAFVDHLDDYLDQFSTQPESQQGYFVFKCLGPNIQLLALALPIFADSEEDRIEAMLETENTELGRRIFPSPSRKLGRAHSCGAADAFLLPTLGIFNAAPPSRKASPLGGDIHCYLERQQHGIGRHDGRRKRASTISCMIKEGNEEGEGEEGQHPPLKTLRWQQPGQMVTAAAAGGANERTPRIRRIYTRRGDDRPSYGFGQNRGGGGEKQLGPDANGNGSLRRAQSERLPAGPRPSSSAELSIIEEGGEIGMGEDGMGRSRKMTGRRHILEGSSPRRVRRAVMMRRGAREGRSVDNSGTCQDY